MPIDVAAGACRAEVPGEGWSHSNLGYVLIGFERLPEAIGRYEQALQLKPDYIDPRRNLAGVLTHLGRVPEAIAHYRVLVRLRPDDQEARAELSRLQATVRP